MKDILLVNKKYNCAVDVSVRLPDISLSVPLDQFVDALCDEFGGVATVISKDTFRKRLKAASERVVKEIKGESARAI